MKKILLILGILMTLTGFVSALDCVVPTDGMYILNDTVFCPGEYNVDGIHIFNEGITLECNNTKLIGSYPDSSNIGIYMTGYNNITLKNCIIENNFVGILAYGKDNYKILNNNLKNNIYQGIDMTYSDNSLVKDNIISYSNTPIRLFGSNNNFIIANLLENNPYGGIELQGGSENNLIYNNYFFNSSYVEGISIESSSFNKIINNVFNDSRGIRILYNSSYNEIGTNLIYGGEKYGSYGIGILPFGSKFGEYNNITLNVVQGFPDGSLFVSGRYNNIWDNDLYTDVKIYLDNISFNVFCVNGIGNSYFDGATGPTCPDSDGDGINDYFDKCPSTTEEQIAYGCSCNQILALKPGKDKGNICSRGVINVFTKQIGWAKDLFD